MIHYITTALRFLAYFLGITFAAAIGLVIGAILMPAEDAPTKSLELMPTHLVHQGWGEGDCADDEWFDGYVCIHIDRMPAHDPRRNLTDYYYTY